MTLKSDVLPRASSFLVTKSGESIRRPDSPKVTLIEKQGGLGGVYQSRGLGHRRFFGLYGCQFANAVRVEEFPCELVLRIDE